MNGFILLHRCLIDKPIWLNSTSEQKVILITLLMMATWKETEWDWNGKKFKLLPGQIVTSQSQLVKKCGKYITTQNIKTALKRFETLGFLTNQSTKQGRIITIENWRLYQDKDYIDNQEANQDLTNVQPTPNQPLTNDQPSNNKQSNNIKIKQDKKNTIPPIIPQGDSELTDQTTNGSREDGLPLNTGSLNRRKAKTKVEYAPFVHMQEQEYASLIKIIGDEEQVKRCIEILDNYKGSTGKTYKDDCRAIRSWVVDRLREEQARRPRRSTGNGQLDEIQRAMEMLGNG